MIIPNLMRLQGASNGNKIGRVYYSRMRNREIS